jgi:peptidoglycan hydrolase-like protein with peptidoglycan-binding domain
MSKFDKLFKKAEQFQKLAQREFEPENINKLYDQFKAQGQAIQTTLAETARNSKSSWLQGKVDKLQELLGMQLNIESARSISNYVSNLHKELVKNNMNALANTIYSNVRMMEKEVSAFDYSAKQTQESLPATDDSIKFPTDNITGRRPTSNKPAVRTIDKDIQSYLGVKPDGILGPETQKALQEFRDKNSIPPAISVINAIRSEMAQNIPSENKPGHKVPFPNELNDMMSQRNQELAMNKK